jgi:ankyrin repeat protein
MVAFMSLQSFFYQIKCFTTWLTGRDTATYYLLRAAETGALSKLKNCITAGVHLSPFFHPTRPLILAAQNGHADIVEYLNIQFDYKQETKALWHAVRLAAQNGHTSTLTHLLSIMDLTQPDTFILDWKLAIYQAIQEKHSQSALILLHALPTTNAHDLADLLPITLRMGLDSVLAYLLSHDARVSENHFDIPLIFYAVASNNATMLAFWLHQTATVNAVDDSNSTPLMLAAFLGNKAMVESLTQYIPEKINQKNRCQESALSIATNCGHRNITEHLIQHGAKQHATTATLFNSKRYDLPCLRLMEHTSENILRFNRYFNDLTCGI